VVVVVAGAEDELQALNSAAAANPRAASAAVRWVRVVRVVVESVIGVVLRGRKYPHRDDELHELPELPRHVITTVTRGVEQQMNGR